MKLISVQVRNFRSIEDSNEFSIDDLTCLVGKNEAGKTAILQALHGISNSTEFKYDKERDYPRRFLAKYDDRHENRTSLVAMTKWRISENDKSAITNIYGENALTGDTVIIKSYMGSDTTIWEIKGLEQKSCAAHIAQSFGLSKEEMKELSSAEKTEDIAIKLEAIASRSESQNNLLAAINKLPEKSAYSHCINILHERMPIFFYTSHFDRMSGEISVTKLTNDKRANKLETSDKIFLDFLEYAGTSIDELESTGKLEELKAKCEGASNDITDEIFQFWSQNEALEVQIDIASGRPKDPPPFNSGTVVKVRINNKNHRASVPLSERSSGFVWFFSFLAQFKQLKKDTGNAILLLDEPGLTLHGKAQADLLRYIQERLLPEHQVIFTTHSPFMVPVNNLASVRVVEDVVEYDDKHRATVKGTKVSNDILSVDKDTLFPLQGHLGYEITQSLFIGKNTLLVEGPSDILFLNIISEQLRKRGRTNLDAEWVICPTGGIDKMMSFASLFGGNKLNIAVLCDYGLGDKNKVERLRSSQILSSSNVFTTSEFTGKNESDIEDLFAPELYVEIINKTYSLKKTDIITLKKINHIFPKQERIVKAIEAYFRSLSSDIPMFDHFAPANWLLRTPSFFDKDTDAIKKTFDSFEQVFRALNKLIKHV